MTRKKITDLTEDISPQLADYSVSHDGVNAKKVTWQKIKDLFGSAASAWGSITGTLSAQTDLQSALDVKQDEATVVSSNQTAVNDGVYTVVASATFTDPSPTEGKGFSVLVRNGTATVGGTAYATAGTFIRRVFHSGAWANYVNQAALGFTAENVANKSTNVNTDQASDTKYPSVKAVYDWATNLLSGKQDTLVNQTNIKSINGSSVLGSGDLTVSDSTKIAKNVAATYTTNTITTVTAAEYAAIGSKDANTLYFIV